MSNRHKIKSGYVLAIDMVLHTVNTQTDKNRRNDLHKLNYYLNYWITVQSSIRHVKAILREILWENIIVAFLGKNWVTSGNSAIANYFFSKTLGGHLGLLISLFWTCNDVCLCFKFRVDSLLVCFLTFVQWIPQIHLWCNTCWSLDG